MTSESRAASPALVCAIRSVAASAINLVPSWMARRFASQGRLSALVRPLVNAVLSGEETVVVVRSGRLRGTWLPIDPRVEKYYWTGGHEATVQEAFSSILRPGDVVWDVGAHIGFFSAIAAGCVGPTGTVHAFEPMPANRARLERTIKLNGLDNIRVHPLAVAERSGEAHLNAHSSTSMWSLHGEPDGGAAIDVVAISLDDLYAGEGYGEPDLIKIDAEGAEVDILRGGPRLLREHGPSLIVEFTDRQRRDEARELFGDYAFEQLSDSHWLMRPSARA